MKSLSTATGPQHSKRMDLIDLNEYCLIRIFRKLTLKDLNAVNATCQQFHGIVVNHVYEHHSSITTFDVEAMGKRYYLRDLDYKLECIKGYLERFGRLIKEIQFDKKIFGEQDNTIFAFIVEYCTDALKSLKMLNVNLDSSAIRNGRSIFEKLTKLDTDNRDERCNSFLNG